MYRTLRQYVLEHVFDLFPLTMCMHNDITRELAVYSKKNVIKWGLRKTENFIYLCFLNPINLPNGIGCLCVSVWEIIIRFNSCAGGNGDCHKALACHPPEPCGSNSVNTQHGDCFLRQTQRSICCNIYSGMEVETKALVLQRETINFVTVTVTEGFFFINSHQTADVSEISTDRTLQSTPENFSHWHSFFQFWSLRGKIISNGKSTTRLSAMRGVWKKMIECKYKIK